MNKFIIVSVLFLSLLLSNLNCFSQIGASISRVLPRAELGVVMKSTGMYELSYQFTDPDEQFRLVTSIGFINFKTREDTLRTYGYISGGGSQLIVSGYELYENYISIPLSFKSDYKFFDKALSPIIGLDANVFFNSYYYEQNIDKIISLSETGSSVFLGLQLRAGLLYTVNDNFDLEFNFGRTATLENGDGSFKFWRMGLGITYYAW